MGRNRVSVLACIFSLAVALPWSSPARAAWPADPGVNVPLCTDPSYSGFFEIVGDGAGGAIAFWYDRRNGNDDIYAQAVAADGAIRWPANGVALCTATGGQVHPKAVPDGAGGAIATWWDGRISSNMDIYAQRVSAEGATRWVGDGVAICAAAASQIYPRITSDGAGGAIVAWQDKRSGSDDVYVQRVSADGTVLWVADGVALCAAANVQENLQLISDGAGGAIVVWVDSRSGQRDIYARRITTHGVVLWPDNGVALCTATRDQNLPTLASDGAGGAIVAWYDDRDGYTVTDIYAQRITADGTVLWATDGVPICSAASTQLNPVVATDGAGGAIVSWYDNRDPVRSADIYAQRVSGDGVVLWAADGIGLCGSLGSQIRPSIVADGVGGAVVGWMDNRNCSDPSCSDIYAQRVDEAGMPRWTANGVALSTANGSQAWPLIATDDAGGAIAAWNDSRNGNYDVYAQRVYGNGQIGGWVGVASETAGVFSLDPVVPNPARTGVLRVSFTLARMAPGALVLVDVAGRLVAARDVSSLGPGRHGIDLGRGQGLAPGIYHVQLRHGASNRTRRVVVLGR